jgi:hypothetical protein
VDDEAIMSAQTLLATFSKCPAKRDDRAESSTARPRPQTAARDTGVSDTSAKQLGKRSRTLVKGTTALAKAGVTFTQQQIR